MTEQLEPRSWRWCFSTLGCSDLALEEICALAREFGIAGIELRGIEGRLDLPDYAAERNFTRERVRALCQENRTRLVVAGSSVKLTDASDQARAELLKFGGWAEAWGIPYLRVFGGGKWGEALSGADYRQAAERVLWWREQRHQRGWHVDLLLETHDAFSASVPCLRLNEHLEHPLSLIWDSHHTWRIGGESIESTWKQLQPWIRHVHLKDSVDRPSARHPYTYVLPGAGQMPMSEVLGLLDTEGFGEFVSLEWERQWHPYLEPLRRALEELVKQPWYSGPHHATVAARTS
jgi:sugar phosphate isomerase/epimerase